MPSVTAEVEDSVSTDDCTNQSQSSTEDASCRTARSCSDHETERSFVIQSPVGSSTSSVVGANPNFSVINYVGKVQKQSSHRSVVRCRTPYERQVTILSQTSRVESIDESTNSSMASSVDGCSTIGDSASVVADATEMADLDDNSRASGGDQQVQVQQPRIHHGPRSRRSVSVSSSGCSSSMDDRNSDFSPLYSGNSCRCTSLTISDFDDDGFREDGSMSSVYTVLSSPRSYLPHHQLHHNHQNVPHHPNNTKGLFDIALKTVKLIRRNQELQARLAQLQEETKAFIESVMANPENESLRNHIQTGGAIRTMSPASVVVVQK